jgi:hypothetical protein
MAHTSQFDMVQFVDASHGPTATGGVDPPGAVMDWIHVWVVQAQGEDSLSIAIGHEDRPGAEWAVETTLQPNSPAFVQGRTAIGLASASITTVDADGTRESTIKSWQSEVTVT